MARKRKECRPVVRVIKLTLDPERDASLIRAIDAAQNKAQLVVDALRGKTPATPSETEQSDPLVAAFSDFLM